MTVTGLDERVVHAEEDRRLSRRRPVGIAVGVSPGSRNQFFVVCDDGSAWTVTEYALSKGRAWAELPPIPGSQRNAELMG